MNARMWENAESKTAAAGAGNTRDDLDHNHLGKEAGMTRSQSTDQPKPLTIDGDTLQYGTEPPFHYWEDDHTALVHVLWDAKFQGLSIDDADALASQIMRSRWHKATLAEGAKQELLTTAQAAMDEGQRRRPLALADWLLARKDRLAHKRDYR